MPWGRHLCHHLLHCRIRNLKKNMLLTFDFSMQPCDYHCPPSGWPPFRKLSECTPVITVVSHPHMLSHTRYSEGRAISTPLISLTHVTYCTNPAFFCWLAAEQTLRISIGLKMCPLKEVTAVVGGTNYWKSWGETLEGECLYLYIYIIL